MNDLSVSSEEDIKDKYFKVNKSVMQDDKIKKRNSQILNISMKNESNKASKQRASAVSDY